MVIPARIMTRTRMRVNLRSSKWACVLGTWGLTLPLLLPYLTKPNLTKPMGAFFFIYFRFAFIVCDRGGFF